ncbi:isopentenyl-diphosphate Delta-isomerase [Mycobacteroides abscessus]|uniref:isopentenyl-diphosphate Delta-isomerase n=1 Tax=Mycobacteroides abscessus TaxID=36809 RepID=UPI0019D1A6C1|nr:isopentenyl-diphosphate Delta-isomerase [Mycobacteroides abscessus]
MNFSGKTVTSEHVVLLDQSLQPIGSTPKSNVHHANTPLHLAVSCYLFDENQRLFVSQRAYTKLTWPGVITNSACGHPLPQESLHSAVHRIVNRELGCAVRQLATVLPNFSYHAVSEEGIVEWEYCPVVVGTIESAELELNPDEVAGGFWMTWDAFVKFAAQQPDTIDLSPWCQLQAAALRGFEQPYNMSDRTAELPKYLA